MKKAAILYDFDKTLCTKAMQEYSLIPSLGYSNPNDFWKEVSDMAEQSHMDNILAYLYLLKRKYEEQGSALQKKDFEALGKTIVLYPGVKTWFRRINAYGKSLGLDVEHYVISSGMTEIIEQTSIADEFTSIFACSYLYDEDGNACWPSLVVNYTTKTQYIFRINKQVLEVSNDSDLNAYTTMDKRPIPLTRMIYIADGLTDVPCMKLVKEHGGKSRAVYSPESCETAKILIRDQRADYMSPADYEEGSDMEKLVRKILDHMHADAELEDVEGKIR